MDGRLRQLFRSHLPMIDWQSVDITGGRGVPDTNGCFAGVEFWVEHKLTRARKVIIRPEQLAWIERRTRAGGRVFIAVRRVTREVDDLHLILGAEVRALATGAWPYPHWGHWTGGPARWNWGEIQAILTT